MAIDVKAYFVLNREDSSLEKIANDAPRPAGLLPIHFDRNSVGRRSAGLYIEDGNVVRPVEKLEEGQKPYDFPDDIVVYM